MKRLSDYKHEDAIDLWMDLLDPIGNILQNEKIKWEFKKGGNRIKVAQRIINECREDAMKILLRIDPTPIDGLNIIVRLVDLIMEFEQHPDLKDFFSSAARTQTDGESSGNATENTEDVTA